MLQSLTSPVIIMLSWSVWVVMVVRVGKQQEKQVLIEPFDRKKKEEMNK